MRALVLLFPSGEPVPVERRAPAELLLSVDAWRDRALDAAKSADEARARRDLGAYWRHLETAIAATERADAAWREAQAGERA